MPSKTTVNCARYSKKHGIFGCSDYLQQPSPEAQKVVARLVAVAEQ